MEERLFINLDANSKKLFNQEQLRNELLKEEARDLKEIVNSEYFEMESVDEATRRIKEIKDLSLGTIIRRLNQEFGCDFREVTQFEGE